MRISVAAVILCVAAASCRAIVDFPEERPCSPGGECLAGFTCDLGVCVVEGSIPYGETCQTNAACNGDLICAGVLFICRDACTRAYGNNADTSLPGTCANNALGQPQACARFSESGQQGGANVAACATSECNATDLVAGDATCDPNAPNESNGKRCIGINGNVGLCEIECTVDCTGTDCVTSGCPGPTRVSCQPHGELRQLACTDVGAGVARDVNDADACDLVTSFCDGAHACRKPADGSPSFCEKYCGAGVACPVGFTCTNFTEFSTCVQD